MELMMREIGGNSAEGHDGGLGRDRTGAHGLFSVQVCGFRSWLFLSMVLLHQSCCFCLSDFVLADCEQIMESAAL